MFYITLCFLGDDVAPGNYAMLDQVAGLQWVHDNIEGMH